MGVLVLHTREATATSPARAAKPSNSRSAARAAAAACRRGGRRRAPRAVMPARSRSPWSLTVQSRDDRGRDLGVELDREVPAVAEGLHAERVARELVGQRREREVVLVPGQPRAGRHAVGVDGVDRDPAELGRRQLAHAAAERGGERLGAEADAEDGERGGVGRAQPLDLVLDPVRPAAGGAGAGAERDDEVRVARVRVGARLVDADDVERDVALARPARRAARPGRRPASGGRSRAASGPRRRVGRASAGRPCCTPCPARARPARRAAGRRSPPSSASSRARSSAAISRLARRRCCAPRWGRRRGRRAPPTGASRSASPWASR